MPLQFWQPAAPAELYTPDAFDTVVGSVIPLIDESGVTVGCGRVTAVNVPVWGAPAALWTVEILQLRADADSVRPGWPAPHCPWPFKPLQFGPP
jgi:hypothetical protein